jgi:hypothetical protein
MSAAAMHRAFIPLYWLTILPMRLTASEHE